jgi:cobalt-precorrin 5A hydrolase
MKTALITLSAEGASLLSPLIIRLPEARLFIHESVWDMEIRGGPVRDVTTIRQDSNRREANRHDPDRRDDSMRSHPEPEAPPAERFSKIADLTAALFPVCRGLVYAAPCGVVVRAIAPLVKSKHEDPAVVVVDAGGRWAVSLHMGERAVRRGMTSQMVRKAVRY